MGVVVSIHRVAGRAGPAVALEAARFVADFGLEGDWRSRSGRGRQITLIEAEALEHVARTLGMDAVPAGASRRQVVVRGLALAATIGQHLRLGEVVVAVEQPCDPCANMERTIGPGALRAMAGRGGVCGRVLAGGMVRPGDVVAAEAG
jgi:MOSC domain-containing protein YiiM